MKNVYGFHYLGAKDNEGSSIITNSEQEYYQHILVDK